MAEEFTLSVSVDADMQKFRTTLRQELEAAQKQTATVPVAATGGPVGTSTVPPGAATATAPPGVAATASTVAQQSAQAAATAAARSQSQAQWNADSLTSWMNAPLTGSRTPAQIASWNKYQAQADSLMEWANAPLVGSRTPAQAAAYAASQAKYGAQADSLMEWANAPLTGSTPGPGGGGGPGVGPDPGWNFGTGTPGAPGGRGPRARSDYGNFGRYGGRILAGFGLHAVSTAISAGQQYDVALARAQGDERQLASAELNYRREMFGALPLIGPGAYALNQAITGDEEYITRTFADADRTNEHTRMMREGGRLQQEARFDIAKAGAFGSRLQRLVADQNYESAVYTARNASAAAGEETAAQFKAQRAGVQKKYEDMLGPMEIRSVTGPKAEAWKETQLQAIQQAQDDAAAKNKEKFGPLLSAAQLVKERANLDINRRIQAEGMLNMGAARGSLLRAQGRPFEASVSERFTSLGAELLTSDDNKASIGLKGAASMAELFADMFRDVSHSHRQLTAQNRITQKLLDRDPLGAKITAIQTETDEGVYALRGLPSSVRGPLEGAVRRGGALRERLERRDDDDARQLRIQSLDNRIEHFSLLAENKPLSAHARDIQRDTEQALDQARKSGRSTQEERIAILQAGIAEEYSFEKQLRRRMAAGFGTEVAAGSYAPGVSGSDTQEPVVRAIGTVKDAIEKLQSALLGVN